MGEMITQREWKTIIFVNNLGEMTSRVCTRCGELKVVKQFGKNTAGFGGRRPDCLPCMAKHKKDKRIADNYENHTAITHRSRAKRYGLPSNMTVELREKAKQEQGYKCLLTHSENIETEHLIPISWGVGLGDTYENTIFMDVSLNRSKGKKNPFEWVKTQPHFIQRRFYNDLIPLLANRSGMTTKEYEVYVNDCYKEYVNGKDI